MVAQTNNNEVNDYQGQYDEYWSAGDRIGESSGELEKIANQIVMSCGFGKILDIGSGEGALVTSLLRRGMDAFGLDVSEVVVSRCNQRAPGRFTQGSVLNLPFDDSSFNTVVSTDCMEHLAPEDVSTALKEMHRVAHRYVFLQIATTQDRDNHWHLTVEGREWWEKRCFDVGFRKHPAYYRINPYELLNKDAWQIYILLEKIPADALFKYPLAALKGERDLHMDMLREYGSRSDAHVSRYHFAGKYVRPGDVVLDAACGLGYGSYIIRNLTKCSTITGIDGSEYGINYAQANFKSDDSVDFEQGFLPDCLSAVPDNSVDCVICFETLEHVENPKVLLLEFHRILTPGGRLISSVPHDWSDETGQDPNPFHLHVYTRSKYISELTQSFEIEHMVGQTADRVKKPGTCEWLQRPRSFQEIDLVDEHLPVEAEWLLSVACKSPLNGAQVTYVEKVFSIEEQAASGHALAFARDYLNPWLIRSLVSVGLRTENPKLRERWAIEVLRTSPVETADYGAALCILAYVALSSVSAIRHEDLITRIDQYIAIEVSDNFNIFRWQVSLTYAQGLIALSNGRRTDAKSYLHRVTAYPVATYSPTLLTKPAEAAYLLGILYASEGDTKKAESVWTSALNSILKDIGKQFSKPYAVLPPGFELREIAATLSITGRMLVAIGNVQTISSQPSIFYDEVSEDMVTKLPWLSSQREAWEKLASQKEQHVTELLNSNAWLSSQREAWEKLASEKEQHVTELLNSNAWLSSQREAWEKLASEKEQHVTELLNSNAWLSSQREAREKLASEKEQRIAELMLHLKETKTQLSDADAKLKKYGSNWLIKLIIYLSRKNIT